MNEGILSLHDAQDQHYFDYAFGVKGMGPVIVPGLRPDDDTTPVTTVALVLCEVKYSLIIRFC